MAHYRLKAPLSDEDILRLHAGDTVTLDGIIFGIRDANLIRLFDKKVELPADLIPQLKGSIGIHTAPGVRKLHDGTYEKISIGTTTSYRMDRFTKGLLKDYGMKVIIGKGGLLEDGSQALVDFKGCYFTIIGGSAALETTQVEAIEDVWWEDLMPEAIWKFRVKDFGPLIVSIDAHGGNKYKDVKKVAKDNLDKLLESLN
ncbi:fumarate hydratase C-terminal domain-containing protein [Neobacillus mesonae]|uniref:fumarate hydratase C-terminal domain-containing protein n=1 Tax=Neobacillus mesonae TaxID=1193713 RepID=UPI00203C555E|nr:fumarate hydratase C-terminal domain-containing protein [Neobacillus mesonae]MCM3567602.1 fumarate hydratase C-terminal domain-containing protein [Neobacillus mesonae]